MQASIGFIGLGYVRHGMAKNIQAKSYDLTVLGHPNREQIEYLVLSGAQEAESKQAHTEASDIIFCACLAHLNSKWWSRNCPQDFRAVP